MQLAKDILKPLLLLLCLVFNFDSFAANQTPDVTPILSNTLIPFRIHIELAKDKSGNDFLLPMGLQSYDLGIYNGKWLLINGRTNGLHGFGPNPDNFPPSKQNVNVFVVDPETQIIRYRSLLDPLSGLTQDQVDSLSVSATQSYQEGNTLYITGGYGYRSSINNFTTFPTLSAIDIPGLMHWVLHPESHETAAEHIRQIINPIFRITGGFMGKMGKTSPTLLVFGNDFQGAYQFGPFTQVYSQQIRRFIIHDDGKLLCVDVLPSKPAIPDPNYRRRDLNVVPMLHENSEGKLSYGLIALSGVFTPSNGVWTVPVTIDKNGNSFMMNPTSPFAFKQGMNNYYSATMGLFSKLTGDLYTVIFGGMSYGFFVNGVFQTDPQIPFINQVSTVKRDRRGLFSQYLMDAEFPVILSTESNPGNPLLFGTSAQFVPANGLECLQYDFHLFKLDKIKNPIVLGYIVGGIESTLPNTTSTSDTAASPYIFKVILTPNEALLKCRGCSS